jgi:prepilin-type N-terminal cleavage/methylation domain-containing protein
MLKNRKNKKGLTLIEVLAVIVILGIVAAIAIPSVMNYVGDSEVKGFKTELGSMETVLQNNRAVSTMLDYAKLTGTTATDGTDTAVFNQEKVLAYMNGSKALPIKDGVDQTKTYVNIQLTATGGVNTATASNGLTVLPKTLVDQLAQVYLPSNGQTVNIKAYPIDVELLYTGKQLSNTLAFPKNITSVAGYGDKYQNRTSAVSGAPKVVQTTATDQNKAGNFFVTDTGRVFYTGTDAVTSDGTVVHMINKNK